MDTEFDELFSFKEYNHSPDGILATVLGGISAVVFVTLLVICMMLDGKAGVWTGSFGFTALFLAFLGMVRGLHSFQDQCRSYRLSKIGTLLSGIMVAIWFLAFCVGLAS